MSFDVSTSSYGSSLFPKNGVPVVTAFWSDIQISGGDGSIYYHLYTDSSSNVIKRAGREITAFTGAHFEPTWVLVATWHQVPKFVYSSAGPEVRSPKAVFLNYDSCFSCSATPFKLFSQRTTFLRMHYTIIRKMDCSGQKVPTSIRELLVTPIRTLVRSTTILFL